MSNIVIDEDNLRELPPNERFSKCQDILENSKDESLRWDAVWLAGEIAVDASQQLFDKVADLMVWVLQNDTNGVVKHEACYQIAARDMREKIPDLIDTGLHDDSVVARHEAIEALGLMRAFEAIEHIESALSDPNPDVKETAEFVVKRLNRLKGREYKPSDIL